MRRRYVVVASTVAVLLSAGVLPASAGADIESVPFDETPVSEFNDGDQGGQVVSVGREEPRADGVQLVAGCHYETIGIPNTSEFVVALAAEASATSAVTAYGAPVSVGVTCTVRRFRDGRVGDAVLTATAAAPGSTVATAQQTTIRYGQLTVCTSMSVHYSDTTFVRTETRCVQGVDVSPI